MSPCFFPSPFLQAEAEILSAIVMLFTNLGLTDKDIRIKVSNRKVALEIATGALKCDFLKHLQGHFFLFIRAAQLQPRLPHSQERVSEPGWHAFPILWFPVPCALCPVLTLAGRSPSLFVLFQVLQAVCDRSGISQQLFAQVCVELSTRQAWLHPYKEEKTEGRSMLQTGDGTAPVNLPRAAWLRPRQSCNL